MSKTIIILFVFLSVTFSSCQLTRTNLSAENPVSAPATDSAEPAVATDSAGNVDVLYVEHGGAKQADIYLQRFSGEGRPAGERIRINPVPGGATAWRGDPPTIKIDDQGTIYIGWTARVDVAEGSANDLYLSRSADGGNTFEMPVKVNDDALPAVHGMHSLEVDNAGHIYFAWLDERYLKNMPAEMPGPAHQPENNSGEMKHQHGEANREVYFAVSTNHGKSFSANKKISGNVCPCCKVSMTTAFDGRLYVSWRQVLEDDFRHIAVSSSVDGGNNFSPFVIVSDDRWQISGCPVSGAAMSVDKDNVLKIAWFTAGTAGMPGIYLADSKDEGKSFSPRVLLSSQNVNGTPVIIQGGESGFNIIFSAIDKTIYSLATPGDVSKTVEQSKIANADLPAAAVTNGRTFIAFIRKTGENRQVFMREQN